MNISYFIAAFYANIGNIFLQIYMINRELYQFATFNFLLYCSFLKNYQGNRFYDKERGYQIVGPDYHLETDRQTS